MSKRFVAAFAALLVAASVPTLVSSSASAQTAYTVAYDPGTVYNDTPTVRAVVDPAPPSGTTWRWQFSRHWENVWNDEQNRAGKTSDTFRNQTNLYQRADIRVTFTTPDGVRHYGPRIVVAGTTTPADAGPTGATGNDGPTGATTTYTVTYDPAPDGTNYALYEDTSHVRAVINPPPPPGTTYKWQWVSWNGLNSQPWNDENSRSGHSTDTLRGLRNLARRVASPDFSSNNGAWIRLKFTTPDGTVRFGSQIRARTELTPQTITYAALNRGFVSEPSDNPEVYDETPFVRVSLSNDNVLAHYAYRWQQCPERGVDCNDHDNWDDITDRSGASTDTLYGLHGLHGNDRIRIKIDRTFSVSGGQYRDTLYGPAISVRAEPANQNAPFFFWDVNASPNALRVGSVSEGEQVTLHWRARSTSRPTEPIMLHPIVTDVVTGRVPDSGGRARLTGPGVTVQPSDFGTSIDSFGSASGYEATGSFTLTATTNSVHGDSIRVRVRFHSNDRDSFQQPEVQAQASPEFQIRDTTPAPPTPDDEVLPTVSISPPTASQLTEGVDRQADFGLTVTDPTRVGVIVVKLRASIRGVESDETSVLLPHTFRQNLPLPLPADDGISNPAGYVTVQILPGDGYQVDEANSWARIKMVDAGLSDAKRDELRVPNEKQLIMAINNVRGESSGRASGLARGGDLLEFTLVRYCLPEYDCSTTGDLEVSVRFSEVARGTARDGSPCTGGFLSGDHATTGTFEGGSSETFVSVRLGPSSGTNCNATIVMHVDHSDAYDIVDGVAYGLALDS